MVNAGVNKSYGELSPERRSEKQSQFCQRRYQMVRPERSCQTKPILLTDVQDGPHGQIVRNKANFLRTGRDKRGPAGLSRSPALGSNARNKANPGGARAVASRLWTKGYNELDPPKHSAKQSQFPRSGRQDRSVTRPRVPATPQRQKPGIIGRKRV